MTYENFLVRVKRMAPGCKPEAIPRWRDFAVECVDSEQFVRFKPTADKTAAVEKWLDVLYSGLKAVASVVNLSLERCCLYPSEMMQAALCVEKGENGKQIFEKIESGEIDCTDLFSAVSRRDAEDRRTVRERLKALKKQSGRGKDRGR